MQLNFDCICCWYKLAVTAGSAYKIKLNSIEISAKTTFSLCPATEQAIQLTFNSTDDYASVFAVEGDAAYFSDLSATPFQHF